MARFYGSVKGSRGEAHRLGTTSSSLVTRTASWHGAVKTLIYAHDDGDCVHVTLEPSQGNGVYHTLYRGPVGEYKPHE